MPEGNHYFGIEAWRKEHFETTVRMNYFMVSHDEDMLTTEGMLKVMTSVWVLYFRFNESIPQLLDVYRTVSGPQQENGNATLEDFCLK